jgi:hypothetical protein
MGLWVRQCVCKGKGAIWCSQRALVTVLLRRAKNTPRLCQPGRTDDGPGGAERHG